MRKNKDARRKLSTKKVKGTTKVGEKKVAPMTYEQAANSIPVKAWISRLGEECSELAAAISKYKRAVNEEFPCRTDAYDAFVSVIGEAIDVTLALEYCTENAFAHDINAETYQKLLKAKKDKIVRQVIEAMQGAEKNDRPQPEYPQLSIYQQLLVSRGNPNAIYGTLGMVPDRNNPMRDALIEDLYDEFD